MPAVEVTGRLRLDGRPLPGADVLVLSEATRRLAGAGSTDEDGAFRIDAEGEGPLVVLAKVRGPIFGLEARPVDGGGPVEIDVDGDATAELRGAAEGRADPRLTVRLDVVRAEGVPDWLVPYATQRRAGVVEGAFCQAPLGEGFRFRLRPGEYRLRGDLWIDGPVGPSGEPPPTLLVTGVRLPDGDVASGDPHRGFLVPVSADTDVVVTVAPET